MTIKHTGRSHRISRLFKAGRWGVLAVAAFGFVFNSSQESEAIERVRITLGIDAWEREGITGEGAVVGDFSGLPPLLSHQLLQGSNPVPITFTNDNINRYIFSSVQFTHDHQTATAGAMVANGKGGGTSPLGIAPDASLLVGWYAVESDSLTGLPSFRGPFPGQGGSTSVDGILWVLMAMTDQPSADLITSTGLFLLQEPYQVATVVNASLGQRGVESFRGEDAFGRIFNAVAWMTDATLVSPTGNEGDREEEENSDMPALSDLGSVFSPASAYNVIGVGALTRNFGGILEISGRGPTQSRNYAETATLYAEESPSGQPIDPPFLGDDGGPESDGGVFRETRTGVDIVAPGDQLNLPGFVAGSGFSTNATSRLWVGTSFSSAIVAGAVGLMHDLGEREGYNIGNVVTRAVLLNSANKSSEGVGVGFDNEQMEDMMDDDRPFVTTIGLDEEVGAGSLDLVRLLNQYHRGTVMTDIQPGDGLNGWGRTNNPANVGGIGDFDSFEYAATVPVSGTDPNVSMVSPRAFQPLMCLMSLGGQLDEPIDGGPMDMMNGPFSDSPLEFAVAQRYGPFNERIESLLDGESAGLVPLQGRRDDPDLDGGDGPNLGGDDNGGTPPATGDENESGGGGAGNPGRPHRTGWDHGSIGEGFIDIPIGLISPNSGISVTLTWNRVERLNISAFDIGGNVNADIVNFPPAGGGDGGSGADPSELIEFEFEDLNLELWQTQNVGGNKLIAASRGVWNNHESIFFEYVGGTFDGSSDGPFGSQPANYFIRIIFEQTLWDYGGFSYCSGGMMPTPAISEPVEGIVDRTRAEVEYGLAWYVDFNASGPEFIRLVNNDTGALDVGIPGLLDNVDRNFQMAVGDVNQDMFVNAQDAALVIQNFGSTNPDFDINDDGVVDALDLDMVALHVGEQATPRQMTKDEKTAEKQRRKDYKKSVKEIRKSNKKAFKKLQKMDEDDFEDVMNNRSNNGAADNSGSNSGGGSGSDGDSGNNGEDDDGDRRSRRRRR